MTSDCVKTLGVILDDTLNFNKHFSAICQSANYHLRALCHIWKLVSEDTAKTVACSMVQGRLDYCNAVLYATSAAILHKLQRIQNSLARIVTGIYKHEHMTPVLAKLHWLPVHYHIQFKIAVITFKALTMQQPHYLSELIQIHVPRRHLRSADAECLAVPRTKLKLTNRAFTQCRLSGMGLLSADLHCLL